MKRGNIARSVHHTSVQSDIAYNTTRVSNGVAVYIGVCRSRSVDPTALLNFLIQQKACRHGGRRYRRFVVFASMPPKCTIGFAFHTKKSPTDVSDFFITYFIVVR